MIDTVIFDLGGVLIDWNPRYLYRQLLDDEQAMERFLAEVCTPEWNEQQDAGRTWAEATAVLRARHPEQAALIDAYWLRWEETLGGPHEETVGLLAGLKRRGHELYALTNWSQETFPVARRRFGFLGWFDGIVVSGEERLIKPDAALYRRLLDRYAIDPRAALYIDDSERNVAAAEALGLRGWHYREADGLRAHLVELGLLGVAGAEEEAARG